ncbi:histone-lysine N-methyltransferase SUVR5-like isoform X2 [Phragmites australis]|uniref:histone-lysine N-methyltransferase SUVR5-like isoform X2 n=1 Tax=Phragmites australis TaxID=29695 RepID=UPI002D7A253D|nr:histone-lysine N-methyltransferase SUVR5-like isoform X2 [Phragmites australis]
MLMDPPIMQVECQLQNDVEKTSSIAYDRKHTLSHEDYGWTGSDVHPTNDAIICNPVEVNNASQTGTGELVDASSENYPVNLDGLPQAAEPRKAKNSDNSCSNDLRCQLNVSAGNKCSQSEDVNFSKQSFSKVDVHHLQEERHHPPSPSTVSLLRSSESNGDVLPSQEDKIAEERVKVDDSVGSASKEEENETSVSPINDMDQIAHNNSCNGATNYKVSQLVTGNAGDEEDHAAALWVKWRGKWQTGIRCCRVDCPLPTLKAKPTHDRKSYIVVFFPRTRTYSWVDMLLVLPIEEYPLPLVNGTHRKWRKLVKDLSVPRRFIMQKLAISMLNFSDELHIEAVIENARKATTWKEFALEASCCNDYTDLGKMLVKLQNMILPSYISCEWLQTFFDQWNKKCKNAHDAETVEILYEELRQSVLWNKVDELWNASVQPELVPEWKTWKQEVMKLFFSSHPAGNAGNFEKNNRYDDPAIDQQISRKRPKLEVRRGETQIAHMGDANCRTPSEDPNRNNLLSNSVMPETVGALESRYQNNVDTFPSNADGQEIAESGSANPALQNARLELDSFKNSRQCSAYIEAKGRQCGRWANDGDIYCCVHQSMHFVDHSSRDDKAFTVETPLCGGMTNMGRKCKHRAQHGSIFCKKHRFQTNPDTMHPENLLSSSEVLHRREESPYKWVQEISNSSAIYSIGAERDRNSQVAVQVKLVPTVAAEISGEKTRVMENTDRCTASTSMANTDLDTPLCIGIRSHDNVVECQDYAKRHTLYCEKHLPKFLKRARDGKSRLISKDVFINTLKGCTSRKDKICLHEACEFLYWFLRNNLSHQRLGLGSDHMPQILAEVSKNPDVGEFLLKLISTEREKLENLWGFGTNRSKQIYSENQEESVVLLQEEGTNSSYGLKCKICGHKFSDDQALGLHWTEVHKKEARWLFRGYSCAACMDSFTNKKVLERHVQERHGAQYLQYSILIRCMSCNSNFLNTDLLYHHIASDHAQEFRLLDIPQRPRGRSVQRTEGTSGMPLYDDYNVEKDDGSQKFTCRLCGLRFDLLPDLGRHHQVAHMNPGTVGHMPPGHGKYQLNRGRHYYSAFKKSLRPTGTIKKRSSSGIGKNFKFQSSGLSMVTSQIVETETASLGKLLDYQCSDVAQTLFSKVQKTKPHPSHHDILSVARSVCCKTSLLAALEGKYGSLPENIFVKAAKLCSDIGIQIEWHQEEFLCPKGCESRSNSNALLPIQPTAVDFSNTPVIDPPNDDETWGMEEYHYVLDSKHFRWKLKNKRVVLCEDVSFGREKAPIVCVIDVDAKDSFCMEPEELLPHGNSVPWQGFHYITERLVDSSLVDSENSMAGCLCSRAECSPEKCGHISLFDSVYGNLVDIHGTPMHGRFAYDENSKLILQEGYPIYECNSSCTCDTSCQNKVLQKGLLVKLELFRAENKGWAIRAAEPIPQGTFVCEYIGEVVKGDEATRNAEREAKGGCSYLFDIASQIDRGIVQSVGTIAYMIDSRRYGNVSRFINHSCSPNLSTRLVLVESKDCQLAHIGLFANQDIAMGEELAYDYRHKLLAGDGCPCHCGAKNCRGRVY